jgi:hypothetical protein
VVVTARHVPANQYGSIELLSTIRDFPFHADATGNVSTDITVPRNIGAGDHIVRICWASTCHAPTTLRVIEPVALASPSPGAPTTPGASPQPTTPGTSPQPTTAPRPGPDPTPVASPRPGASPTPPPVPTPSPKPTPTPSAYITLNSVSVVGNTSVTFHYFYVGTANVYVCQGGTCRSAGTVTVAPGPNTLVMFKTPAGILPTGLLAGQAYVVANSLKSDLVNVGA